jgi:outer membrane receptor protein involved in Fe transport
LNSSSQTSYGGSLNLTKILDKHQITTGASMDLAQMRYGAQQAECDVSSARGMENCDAAVDNAAVRGGSYAIGLYASDTWSASERTFVTGAARLNHANVRNTITSFDTNGVGTDQARESHSYNSFNPSIGVSHKLAPMVTVFTNLGQSNRVPTIIELGCADKDNPCALPTGLQADPALKQVIARTLEAGTRWRLSEESEFTVAVYRTENSDDILFRPTSTTGGFGYFTNFSRTRRQGIDISARTQIGSVSLQASYNYLNATYQSDGELFGGDRNITVTKGTKMAGLPDHTLRLSADWMATSKLTIGGSMLATSSIVSQGNEDGLIGDNEAVNAKVSGYYLLNMHANYEAERKGLEYFARVNNLLDRRYETYGMMALSAFDQNGADNLASNSAGQVSRFVAPGAPRNFMVGMRYRF